MQSLFAPDKTRHIRVQVAVRIIEVVESRYTAIESRYTAIESLTWAESMVVLPIEDGPGFDAATFYAGVLAQAPKPEAIVEPAADAQP